MRDIWRTIKHAGRRTGRLFRRHLLVDVFLVLAIYAIAWASSHERRSQADALNNAAISLVYTLAACVSLLILAFVFNLIRAPLELENTRLAPGPDAVAAEQDRLRALRAWVGQIRSEIRDRIQAAAKWKKDGHYWDVDRESVDMEIFAQSGGLLASEPTTETAYLACDDARRELNRLSTLVRRRWSLDMGASQMGPAYVIHQPDVHDSDNIDALVKALHAADAELSTAMRLLKRSHG